MKMRRWILLDLWVLSLAGISLYGGAVSYGIFFGVTLIPVISLVYLAAVYFNLKILQQIEGRNMVCGQAVPYLFILQNESFCVFAGVSVGMFSSFSYVEELPGNTEYELLPKDKKTFETKLTCRYRGEYEVGVKEIIMTDFLKLFRIRYRIPHAVKVQVLPKTTRVTRLNSIDDLTAFVQRESSRERTEPDVVVRDYVTGDAFKQIHWKATARERKLKVRNRIGEEKQGISLMWDTRRYSRDQREYLPIEDKILETVVALGLFLADKNISFSAYYGQKNIVTTQVRGIRDFDGFYRSVSEIVFDRDEDFCETLEELAAKGSFYDSRIVFCVLHKIDDWVMKIAKELDRAGTLTVFYVVTDENIDRYLKLATGRSKVIAVPLTAKLEGIL
ncbi:MAG: DUF58 domain-containing protein [Eubacterium sp.]|nr:DUF58 domain-containing protein [Eubacterium sp.]